MLDIPLVRHARKHEQVLKYLVSGGTAFVVSITTLYLLTELAHVYYLASTVMAFFVSFGVSFVMQKFWTFKDHSRDQLYVQVPLYLAMQAGSLALNTFFMYAFVEYLHVWYILSQFIIALGLAIGTFFINKLYIFKPSA